MNVNKSGLCNIYGKREKQETFGHRMLNQCRIHVISALGTIGDVNVNIFIHYFKQRLFDCFPQ